MDTLVFLVNLISKTAVFLVLTIPMYFLLNWITVKLLAQVGKSETITSNIIVFVFSGILIVSQIDILNVY